MLSGCLKSDFGSYLPESKILGLMDFAAELLSSKHGVYFYIPLDLGLIPALIGLFIGLISFFLFMFEADFCKSLSKGLLLKSDLEF